MIDQKGNNHDKLGRFAPKGKSDANADVNKKSKSRNEKLHIGLQHFNAKRQNSEIEPSITNKIAFENMPKEIVGFENGREKTPNHQEHMRELGYKDEKQYQKGAIDFWNNKNFKTYFSQFAQRYYKYDAKTQRFLAVSTKGVLKTFFKMSHKKFKNKERQEKLYEL